MKLDTNKNITETNVNSIVKEFKVHAEGQRMLIQHTTEKLYTNPIRAIVREYYQNALDSHKMAKCENVPVEITAPTKLNPIYSIRDFGVSMDESELDDLFFSIGESNKRDSDEFAGGFGIGKLCFAAYHLKILILTIFKDGMKADYHISLNAGDSGIIPISKTPTDEPEGVKVAIQVRAEDISLFNHEIAEITKWSKLVPIYKNCDFKEKALNVNIEKETDNILITKKNENERYNNYGTTSTVALIGQLPAGINYKELDSFDEFKAFKTDNRGNELSHYLANLGIVFKFKVGEVDLTSSRDDVQYTDKTKASILKKLKDVGRHVLSQVNVKLHESPNLLEHISIVHSEIRGEAKVKFLSGLNKLYGSTDFEIKGIKYKHKALGKEIDVEPMLPHISYYSNNQACDGLSKIGRSKIFESFKIANPDMALNPSIFTCGFSTVGGTTGNIMETKKHKWPSVYKAKVDNFQASGTMNNVSYSHIVFRTSANYSTIKGRIEQSLYDKGVVDKNVSILMIVCETTDDMNYYIKLFDLQKGTYSLLDDLEYVRPASPLSTNTASPTSSKPKAASKLKKAALFEITVVGDIVSEGYKTLTSRAKEIWTPIQEEDLKDKTVLYVEFNSYLPILDGKYSEITLSVPKFLAAIRNLKRLNPDYMIIGFHKNQANNVEIGSEWQKLKDVFVSLETEIMSSKTIKHGCAYLTQIEADDGACDFTDFLFSSRKKLSYKTDLSDVDGLFKSLQYIKDINFNLKLRVVAILFGQGCWGNSKTQDAYLFRALFGEKHAKYKEYQDAADEAEKQFTCLLRHYKNYCAEFLHLKIRFLEGTYSSTVKRQTEYRDCINAVNAQQLLKKAKKYLELQ